MSMLDTVFRNFNTLNIKDPKLNIFYGSKEENVGLTSILLNC